MVPTAGLGAYSASKAGVEALGRSLRVELRTHGVGVGVAYYLFLNTPMVAASDDSPIFARTKSRLPAPLAKTWPLEPAVARTVRGIERRSRAVAYPPFLRGMMAARGLLDNPLLDRVAGRRDALDGAGVLGGGRARGRGGGRARRGRTVIPGYAIVREVGRGGMGVVYEAVEEALGRTVALKVVAPERVREEGFRERFVAESRMAASLDHPNVLPVFGAGETADGMLWLSMRLVTGADLRSLAPLPATRAAAIVAQVGAALDAAHERRLVHRDVKPANVLVTASDHAYLTDFGLVKALDHGTTSRAPARSSGRSTTSRPNASAARATAPPPTCTRSAACSTSR